MTDQPTFRDPMPASDPVPFHSMPFADSMEFSDSMFSDPMVGALYRLQTLVLDVPDVTSFLSEVAGLAPTVLQPSASCGIHVYREGRPLPAVSSDDRAAQLDETQYQLDEGPCLQTMQTGQPVYVADAATEPRWGQYMEVARDRGLRSSISLPLTVNQATVGAMNLFAFHSANAFDRTQRQRCLLFAAHASAALQLTTRLIETGAVRRQLEQALASRAIIGQAMGIVMARHHCDADLAFAVLRRRSQTSNRKLRDIAADLVAATTQRRLTSATPENRPDSGPDAGR
jgi:GAF domain-containing protein